MEKGRNYLINALGEQIPVTRIKPTDLRKHKTVEKIFTRIERFREKIMNEKQKINQEVSSYFDFLARQHNEQFERDPNCTLTNFSGTRQIIIKSADVIEFNEQIYFAISKIKNCLKKWGNDSNTNLALITSGIFNIEKSGKINRNFLLSLLKYNIRDKEWLEAIEIIKESLTISRTKEYMIFRKRENKNLSWQTIKLNISNIEEGK